MCGVQRSAVVLMCFPLLCKFLVVVLLWIHLVRRSLASVRLPGTCLGGVKTCILFVYIFCIFVRPCG